MAISAQDYAEVDYQSVNGGSEIATPIAAGTVVATGMNGLEVKVACDDSYKTTGANTDGYEAYMFNGTYLNGMTGITGNANPKAADGTPLTYFWNYNNAVPVDGCAYTFTVPGNDPNKLVGYFYACGKLRTNKQYWVTEDTYAIGYEIDMVLNGKAEHFEVVGDPNNRGRLSEATIKAQFTNLPPSVQAAGGWTDTPSLDEMRGYDRSDWQGTGNAFNGMGYIKFPVYEGMTYYFGVSGSKYLFSAFYLASANDESRTVALRSSEGTVADMLLDAATRGCAVVDYMSIDGGSGVSTKLQSGTVVATDGYGLEVKAACEDDYKSVAVNTDGYEAYMFNGTYLNGMTGIMGSANPRGANGYALTYFAAYDNAVPADGTAYTFTVPGNDPDKLVGYFYACGKPSTNKQYWVTEGTYAIGYEIDMVVNGKAEHFEVLGDPENRGRLSEECIKAQFTDLPPFVQAAGGWTSTPSLDEMRGYDRNEWWNEIGVATGMGYIKFPVYEGMTYYFGASGSKYQFSAFYLSSGDEEVEVYLRDHDGELDDLLLTPEEEPDVPVGAEGLDYGEVDNVSVDGGSFMATGTVVATGINGLEVGVACDDFYNTVNTSTDDYEAYVFNGTYLNGMTGIVGNINPKAADGTPLTYFANYNNAVPADGTAYTFTVPGNDPDKLVGYFYACGKPSTNKQYWVTEGTYAIGYEIDMVVNGKAEHFEVLGDPENRGRLSEECIKAQFTDLPPFVQAAGGWTSTPSLDEMRGYDRNEWWNEIGVATGMGYIKFPVYEGMTYYFGGSGSKYQFSAFYLSSGDEEVEVYLRDNDGELDDLLLEETDEPVSVNVPDYGGVGQALSLVDAIGVALPGGTVVALGEKEGYAVQIACDDTYKTTGAATDGYDAYVFNGTQLDIVAGITGNANPLTADGRNMGYIEDYGNAMPASGCAYAFTAPGNDPDRLVGYFYACGKFSLNKVYWVTEESSAIGYEIDIVNDGKAEHFAVKGDPDNFDRLSQETIDSQFTNLPPSIQAAGGWTSTPSLDEMRGYDRNTWPGPNTGMGYIKFPVYEGMTYYFGVAGSKYPFSAFYLSSGNERVTVLLRDDDGELDDLLLSGEEPTSISSHDAMEVVQEEYYTVSGIRVPALAPGLNLVRQVFSDGSVRTVKVVR